MPPKAKFTKDEILEKALQIVRTDGISKLTSRELGTRLNSSARPIFTAFDSMDEVKQGGIGYAREQYRQYVERGLTAEPAFQGVGIAAMCATNLCNYTMEQMKEMMKEVFDGLLFLIKSKEQ